MRKTWRQGGPVGGSAGLRRIAAGGNHPCEGSFAALTGARAAVAVLLPPRRPEMPCRACSPFLPWLRSAPARRAPRPGAARRRRQFWRPAAAKGAWLIAGHTETQHIPAGRGSTPRHQVVILVNGAEAMRAEMPRDRPVEPLGRAEGSALAAVCAPRMLARAMIEVTCAVDNARAASLVFTAGARRVA